VINMLVVVIAIVGVLVAAVGAAVAYRSYQHQRRVDLEPDLQFETYTAVSSGESTVPRGEEIWAASLRNIAKAPAKDTLICLFTSGSVARDQPGQSGLIAPGERWELMLDQTPAVEADQLKGATWARANDNIWYARSLDGRGAQFRSEPTEVDVLAAFQLQIPTTAISGRCLSRRL
jgi:hypothetical protein